MRILREGFHQRTVRGINIFRVSGKGYPAEGPFTFTKERPDVGRCKTGEFESVGFPAFAGKFAEIVAIIERNGAALLQLQHISYMARHAGQ